LWSWKWWQFWWKQIASIKKDRWKESGLFLSWLYKGRNKSGKNEDLESTSRSAKRVVALKETMKIKIIASDEQEEEEKAPKSASSVSFKRKLPSSRAPDFL
jgi:hypothetical protein